MLTDDPPSPKFDILFEAAGLAYPLLYQRSEDYLIQNGTYVSVGSPCTCRSLESLVERVHQAGIGWWYEGQVQVSMCGLSVVIRLLQCR